MPATNYAENVIATINLTASGAVTAERFIKHSGAQAGLGEKALGVAPYDALTTEDVAARLGIVRVLAGDTVTQGSKVTSDALGKAIPYLEDSRVINKVTDEEKISTTTYADDTVLKNIDLRISKTYRVHAELAVENCHSSAATVKYKFILPSGATFTGNIVASVEATAGMLLVAKEVSLLDAQTLQIAAPSTTTTTEQGLIVIDGILTMGTTAGNLDLQWAPNSSIAANLTMKGESFIKVDAVTPEGMNGYAMTAGTASNIMLVQTA